VTRLTVALNSLDHRKVPGQEHNAPRPDESQENLKTCLINPTFKRDISHLLRVYWHNQILIFNVIHPFNVKFLSVHWELYGWSQLLPVLNLLIFILLDDFSNDVSSLHCLCDYPEFISLILVELRVEVSIFIKVLQFLIFSLCHLLILLKPSLDARMSFNESRRLHEHLYISFMNKVFLF
jgi:hypothetical protein